MGGWDVMARNGEFGRLLRSCREQARLSQVHLAHLSGLSVRTIRELEQGRTRRPHRDTARLLADALGIQGADRRAFERQAARGAPAPVSGLPLPGQLPSGATDFTGRANEVAALRELLAGRTPGPAIGTVWGAPGIGKTVLAVHVARQVRSSFPDGQLFVDLKGSGLSPAAPAEVLGGFLRALGIETGAIPQHLSERAALYRSCLADARILVVLDAARDEAQVRPLLPGGDGCAALVTSRAPLAGLEAGALRLSAPATDEALQLLAAVAGRRRIAAEPDAAFAVAELCGRLPLALRAAGARLRTRPHWRLATLADRLADEGSRLDELTIGDLAVRTRLDSCYAGLGEPARRAVRALASLGGADIDSEAAARRLAVSRAEAERLLEDLADAWLVEVVPAARGAGPRYRLPELVRVHCLLVSPVSDSGGPPPSR